MPDFIVMALSVTVVLGIMVLVHEWGHFVVAKAFGVRVEVFSIGFGTRLWGRKRGDTDYRISALPLGGYVKMAGDNPLEDRKGDPDEFLSRPRWQRALIAVAGPAMNVILSVLLIAGVYVRGSNQPAYLGRAMVLVGVMENSTAQKAGLAAGDHIVAVNGKTNPTWEQARMELMTTLPGRTVSVTVEREGQQNGQQSTFELPAGPYPADVFGYPADQVIVGAISPGMPAERSGLRAGDRIVSINGEPISNAAELPSLVQRSEGKSLMLEVDRNGRQLSFEISPEKIGAANGTTRWQIGVMPAGEMVERRLSVGAALVQSVALNSLLARQISFVVVELFRGNISLRQLEGPLGIARESGRAARQGAAELLSLMAVIGMNLAVLNLLPIPPLDGGHILFLFIESVMRRDLSVRIKERFVTASMVFLLLVFAIVMYNDVLRMIR